MTAIWLAVSVLAVWGVASLVAYGINSFEDNPFAKAEREDHWE